MYDLELNQYIEAEAEFNYLLKEYKTKREKVFSGCFAQMEGDPITYDLLRYHYRTEEAGLELVDLSAQYEKRLKRLKRNVERLKEAMNILTEEERQAFNHITYGQPSEFDYWRNRDLNRNARDKLIHYLTDLKDQDNIKREQERKDQLKKQLEGVI
ncbi:hypothetical protein [Piscibacillus halophilus]|uniref:hypothetical protein n=1 Tax=Piscibacillus halophilus TaxID=571933 RepID=UPI00158A01D9|nr:hypothetical protein [Piscibacillus halophilus]